MVKRDKIILELNNKIQKKSDDEITLKLLNQERSNLINELENKSKSLLETETQLNITKNEYNQLKHQHKTLKDNYEELNEKNETLEKTISDLNNKINNLDQEKQQDLINFEKKLRLAELNFVENNSNSKTLETDKIQAMTKDYVAELVDLIRNKVLTMQQNFVRNEKNDTEFRNKMVENIDRRLKDAIDDLKITFERLLLEEKNLMNKRLQEIEMKNLNEENDISGEWYKERINELNIYKKKYNQEAYLIDKLKEEKDTLTTFKRVYEEKNNFLESYLKSLNETLEETKYSREKYKNAFSDAEKLFVKYVKNKNLRELINFKD